MGKIVAIANQKGGVGKTTTAVNIAACVGAQGKKVLLVDSDPQGNASSGFGFFKHEKENSIYPVLVGEKEIEEVIQTSKYKNVDVITSCIDLAGAEVELAEMDERNNRMKTALSKVSSRYDFIFIDCPPSLGLLTVNALVASNTVLMPMQCEFFALEGISQLMNTIRQVKRLYNPQIEIEGVLLTMFNPQLNLTNQVMSEVKKFFPGKVFKTTIPRNVRLSEAPSYGEPVYYYERSSKGAIAYNELASEFLHNNR